MLAIWHWLTSDVGLFWMIHLFLGIAVPLMIYWACCGPEVAEEYEAESEI
jgi:hypothetical protein